MDTVGSTEACQMLGYKGGGSLGWLRELGLLDGTSDQHGRFHYRRDDVHALIGLRETMLATFGRYWIRSARLGLKYQPPEPKPYVVVDLEAQRLGLAAISLREAGDDDGADALLGWRSLLIRRLAAA